MSSLFGNNLLKPKNSEDAYQEHPYSEREITTKEWRKDPRQRYTGEVFHGNLHGRGFYFVDRKDNKLYYDGLFYTNKLEGYSHVFYNDGCHFQGLFKENKRFGPGVFTYPDGSQDAGLWNGRHLVRLGGVNQKNVLPRLATTNEGQLKLLKYRYLVPVSLKLEDAAYNMLQKLGADEEVLKRSHELYNLDVNNKRSPFFNKALYDKHFFGEQDCFIDVAVSDDEEAGVEDVNETEESRSGKVDIHVERMSQISTELEIIEEKLQGTKERRLTLEQMVEYCKACCGPELESGAEGEVTEFETRSLDVDGDSISDDLLSVQPSLPLFFGNIPVSGPRPADLVISSFPDPASSSYISGLTNLTANPSGTSVDTLGLGAWTGSTFQNSSSDRSTRTNDDIEDACPCDEAVRVSDLYQTQKELEAVRKDELFYESIIKNLKRKLDKHLNKSQQVDTVKTKKVLVKEVLAWNNENLSMRILKHSFRHRKSEYMVNFDVSDLFTGNRALFGNPGPHERNCIEFLTACSNGDNDSIYTHIQRGDIDINVCDVKGNNGIFYAAINIRTGTIKILVELGANLDQGNDEGLLPLSMCLLKYLEKKHPVANWEESFLPDGEPTTEQDEACKWYLNMSLLNLLSQQKKTAKNRYSLPLDDHESSLTTARTHKKRCYVFDTGFNLPEEGDEGMKVTRTITFPELFDVTPTEPIENSIKTLLDCGVNPNTGESPLPPLFLSLFTEDSVMVGWILTAGADVQVTIDHDMTALHVVASLKCSKANVDICSTLIFNNCDPRMRTSADHWLEQKAAILGDGIDPDKVEDRGKNPLHILCMRKDFETDHCGFFKNTAGILTCTNIDCGEQYLGHTPLSLAVLVGNQKLVEDLISLSVLDPHLSLGNDMGNVLTVYILKRYELLLPQNAKNILKLMIDQGVNPLKEVGEFENAIAFMRHEHNMSEEKSKSKSKLDVSVPIKKPSKVSKSPKKAQVIRGCSQNELKSYIIELGRDAIVKHIQLLAIENLYNLIEDHWAQHECVPLLAEFLTPIDAILNLQILFRNDKINSERFDKAICLQLVDIVNACQLKAKERLKESQKKEAKGKNTKKPEKLKDGKNNKLEKTTDKKSNKSEQNPVKDEPVRPDYEHILSMIDFKVLEKAKTKFSLVHPGLDTTVKYKVCFHCLLGQDKHLLRCPRCQLVYFCSDLCNSENLKLETSHTCHINFYHSEHEKLKHHGDYNKGTYSQLFKMVKTNCEERLLKKVKEERERKRIELEKEMKEDIYGTKFMFKKTKKLIVKKSPTVKSLFGSVSSSLTPRNQVNAKTTQETKVIELYPSKTIHNLHESKYQCMVDKKHVSTMIDLCTATRKDTKSKKPCPKNRSICGCKEQSTRKGVCKKIGLQKSPKAKPETKKARDIKVAEDSAEPEIVVKKLRKIPGRYKEFIGLLTEYFPDVNFSSMLLPYACYSNGHLYYKFLDNDFYAKTYSMV